MHSLLIVLSWFAVESSSSSGSTSASEVAPEIQGQMPIAPNPKGSGSIDLSTSGLIGYAPQINSQYTSDTAPISAVFEATDSSFDSSSMNLTTCVGFLQDTLPAYKDFSSKLTWMENVVSGSSAALAQAQRSVSSILKQENIFSANMVSLQALYNQLSARLNTISSWMVQEKYTRDALGLAYNALNDLHAEQNTQVIAMGGALDSALRVLASVESQVSKTVQNVANAQLTMAVWARNVSANVDDHTIRLDSLADSVRYRITQMTSAETETYKLTKLALALAIKYQDPNLVDSAYAILNQLTPPTN